MKLNVAIVEDESVAANLLGECLETFGEEEGISFTVAIFSSAEEFFQFYQSVYDIVFMDIRMSGINGMQAAKRLRTMDPVTTLVFVTNMVQYAVRGYEVDAVDFILKPVRYPSFRMKMKRIMQIIKMNQNQGIVITVDGISRVIPTVSIHYVEVINHDLTYHTETGEYTMRGNLGTAERNLPANIFFRCSASYLINLRYVNKICGDEVDVNGTNIRISRTKKKALVTALTSYLGKGV